LAAEVIIQVASAPGVKRDGTVFEGSNYVSAQWCRFQRGLPRKMPGYRAINKYLQGISRTLLGYTQNALTYVHAGSANAVERFTVDGNGNTSIISDRTPSTLTADDLNMWQFDTLTEAASETNQILAQVAPNLECICSSTAGQLFTGDLLGTGALTEVTGAGVPGNWNPNGGVVTLHPYAFVYGSDGYVAWSVPGDPADFTGSGAGNAYVTGQKIVRGLPFRGGPGNSPSGLFWSADSLIRASYIGGTPVFQFDTISAQTSILGAQAVIEYDGVFYWAGTDRFQMFNGVVREVENNMNLNWFYDNINPSQRQKVFAYKVPRFGEIWWCFPFGTATECTHAVIYNVRENTWYDTELPNGGRAAGLSPAVFRRPMLTGVEPQDYIATVAAVAAGGTGYAVGDVLTIDGGIGSISVELTVATETAGVIDTVTISNAGSYETTPSNPAASTAVTGIGADATFTLTFVAPYRFWIHEIGANEVVEQNEQPILSYFETGDIMLPLMDGMSGVDKSLSMTIIEPDFVQSGPMSVQLVSRSNARAPELRSALVAISEQTDEGVSADDQIARFKFEGRQVRFYFESNAINGAYQMGQVLVHIAPTDGRITS
jgi:hypothetical protein